MDTSSARAPKNLLRLVKWFGKATRGDTAATFDLIELLMAMIPDAQRNAQGEALRNVPAVAEMLASRPLLPAGFGPEMLQGCAPGTLGHAYVQLMREFNLTPEFLRKLEPTNDLTYLHRHLMETRDIWHIVTDCPVSLSGELSTTGFYLGQFSRYLRGTNAAFPLITAILLVALLLRIAHADLHGLPGMARCMVRHVTRGWRAQPLLGVRWETLWHRPLADVQREYLLS